MNFREKGGGRKSDSIEYDKDLLYYIKEASANDIAITSSDVICKVIEIIPGFKDKTYDSLHHWFKRFRKRYSFSIRKVTKVAQQLPTYYLEDIREFLFNNILEVIKYKTDTQFSLIANVDETPVYL